MDTLKARDDRGGCPLNIFKNTLVHSYKIFSLELFPICVWGEEVESEVPRNFFDLIFRSTHPQKSKLTSGGIFEPGLSYQ